jgi:hypothetical protein
MLLIHLLIFGHARPMMKQLTAANTPTRVMIASLDQDLVDRDGVDVSGSVRTFEELRMGFAIAMWVWHTSNARTEGRKVMVTNQSRDKLQLSVFMCDQGNQTKFRHMNLEHSRLPLEQACLGGYVATLARHIALPLQVPDYLG